MNPGNILPNEHFTGLISLESRPIRDIEEPAGFGGESDDVIVPAAVIATASVGNEDHFGFAVAVEVLPCGSRRKSLETRSCGTPHVRLRCISPRYTRCHQVRRCAQGRVKSRNRPTVSLCRIGSGDRQTSRDDRKSCLPSHLARGAPARGTEQPPLRTRSVSYKEYIAGL